MICFVGSRMLFLGKLNSSVKLQLMELVGFLFDLSYILHKSIRLAIHKPYCNDSSINQIDQYEI